MATTRPVLDTDWRDPLSHITPNFSIDEACWLPKVNCWYYPSMQERENITRVCRTLELIRTILDKPIVVHSLIRPEWYNQMVGGSKDSYHIKGLAVDFHVRGMTCDLVREVLKKHAEQLQICIEDAVGTSWVHIDLGTPRENGGRFFKP